MDARLAMEESIAAKVNEAEKPDTVALDVDENGDLQYQRDEKGRFAPKEEAEASPEADKAPVEAATDTASPTVVTAPVSESANTPRKVKVKVYGQEEEVDADTLIEHGIKNYQKDRAADIKLQNAARLERQWLERTQGFQQAQPPQGVEQGTTQQDVPQRSETEDERMARHVYNFETQRARTSFDKEFPEIAADPFLMNMAAQLEQERLATAAALGGPLGDPVAAYREHGETVRKWIKKFQPAQTVVTSEDKTERKRTIVAVPSASARAPQPKEEKPQTTSEIIAEMAAQRKAGRPVPQRSH